MNILTQLLIGICLMAIGVHAIIHEDKIAKFERKAWKYVKAFCRALGELLANLVSAFIPHEPKYRVITLCGSTKFKDDFIEAQKQLTLQGNIVISVGLFGHSGDNEVWTENTKEMLDDIHKRKIDMSDGILVINRNDYIGSSTKSEIAYAKKMGKEIRYMFPHNAQNVPE